MDKLSFAPVFEDAFSASASVARSLRPLLAQKKQD
jgi:hypothetical protein